LASGPNERVTQSSVFDEPMEQKDLQDNMREVQHDFEDIPISKGLT
jgi:hypothetical protein